MADFPSYFSYSRFASHVHGVNRHFLGEEHDKFLRALVETAPSRIGVIPAGSKLCRAQKGCLWVEFQEGVDMPAPFEENRLRPLPTGATEGRANPKGIPCLYLASHTGIAVAETRPWKGALVSVGIFEVIRDLRVVDCSRDKHPFKFFFDDAQASETDMEERAWSDVNGAFTRPITREDNDSSYAPTQIIADLFKSTGYDGIAYGSALGEGTNFAMFDLQCVRMESAHVFTVKDLITVSEVEEHSHHWRRPREESSPEASPETPAD